MNNLFSYLVELNISLMILFVAYKLFFEKDKNFMIRRIYLLSVVILPMILPLLPVSLRMPVGNMVPVTISLEEITIFGTGSASEGTTPFPFTNILLVIYLLVLSLGLIKVMMQLARILHAIITSERFEAEGVSLIANPGLHASSFFGYIFIDPASAENESFSHILEHEKNHKREWHSIDRILVELFVMINWFNPVAWMFRRSVIENLEYLADSAVLRRGTDPMKYQLSILNQYIGSASISNQFSSQIKNRINMLNKNYKLGSRWKLTLLFPLTVIAFFFVSCTEKEKAITIEEPETETIEPAEEISAEIVEEEVFFIVEEMPTFNGGEPATEFRKYIAQNLQYPEIAIEKGVNGRVILQFAVNKTGQVVDAVVVRSVDPALDKESIRVVLSSPKWTPGKQHGKVVKVLFTFPINFVL